MQLLEEAQACEQVVRPWAREKMLRALDNGRCKAEQLLRIARQWSPPAALERWVGCLAQSVSMKKHVNALQSNLLAELQETYFLSAVLQQERPSMPGVVPVCRGQLAAVSIAAPPTPKLHLIQSSKG